MNKSHESFYYKKAKEKGSFSVGHRKTILDFIKERAVEQDFLLEVGCGTAEISKVLPEGVKYYGIDSSPFAIEKAKKENEKQEVNLCLFNPGQEKLNFNNKYFNFVLSVYSLEHFKNPRFMLDEMVRVLKPYGYLIILAPNLEMPLSFLNAIRHKNVFFKIWLATARISDYLFRVVGQYRFRTIKNNFTEETGKYEKLDDDLSCIVSSYEVVNYLKKFHKMKGIFIKKFNGGKGIKNKIKKIITFMPSMKYYGDVLFVIMQKINYD